jgi:hypothetical protein
VRWKEANCRYLRFRKHQNLHMHVHASVVCRHEKVRLKTKINCQERGENYRLRLSSSEPIFLSLILSPSNLALRLLKLRKQRIFYEMGVRQNVFAL